MPALSRKHLISLLIAFTILVVLGIIVQNQATTPPDALLRNARRELARGNYSEAESLALAAIHASSDADHWTWMVAAESAFRSNRPKEALVYYQKVA